MKPAYILLPVLASIGIVAAAVVSLWVIGSASGERARFSSLEIAPQEIDLFLAINTDPTSPQWLAVNDSLDDINAKDPLREALDDALADFDLEWERDILPVAGDEAYVAVPDVTEIEGSVGWIAGIRLSDTGQARDVFDKIREQGEDDGDEPFEEEEYEGVTIYVEQNATFDFEDGEFVEGTEGGAALAFVDDVLAFAGSADDVKTVIDVVQGRGETAKDNERLMDFRDRQREDFLVWGYADLEDVWGLAEDGINSFPASFGGGGGSEGGEFGFEEPFFPTPSPLPPITDADFTVASFDAEYSLTEFGDLQVVETINVDFGAEEKHGIFRDLPNIIPYDAENDLSVFPEVTSVLRDGVDEQYDIEFGHDTTRTKIGDPDVTITGAHEYTIEYVVYGAVVQDESSAEPQYDVAWPVTGQWPVPIQSISGSFAPPQGHLLGSVSCAGDFAAAICLPTADSRLLEFATNESLEPGGTFEFSATVSGESGAFAPILIPRDVPIEDDEPPVEDDEPDDPIPDIDTEELFDELRGTYDRVGFSFSSLSEGFAFDFNVVHAEGFEPDFRAEPTTAYDSALAQLVPEDAMFFFSVFDVYNQSWLPAKDQFDKIDFGDGNTIDDALKELRDETGIDLEDDVLAQLTREIAIAGNVRGFDDDPPDFEVFALADLEDADAADETLDKLEGYLESQDAIEADSDDGVRVWEIVGEEDAEPVGVTVENGRLIVGYPDDAVGEVTAGGFASLADANDWKRTIEILPDDKTFVGFVSIARILAELRDSDDYADDFEKSTSGELSLDDLAPIRSVGFSGTASDDGFGWHAVLFMEDR